MGDTQSAQREAKSDAAVEEEEREVIDAEPEQNLSDKVLRTNGQLSEIHRKAENSTAGFNDLCEDEIAVEAVSADTDASDLPTNQETPAETELPGEADQVGPQETIKVDAKQNDVNESFRKFFSNIGLKVTVKRGSADSDEITRHEPEEEQKQSEDIKDSSPEVTAENHQQDLNTAREAGDDDSTTYKTLTDVTPPEEETTGTKEKDAGTASPASEDVAPEEEARPSSPTSPDEKEIATQFKKFFTTGIFSSFRKKKSLVDDSIPGKELLDMGENVTAESTDQGQQPNAEEKVPPATEGATAEKHQQENLTDEAKPASIAVNEIPNSQEKDRVQASPLKRLLSGSSLKKLSKKQRSRRSSDAKLSDSGEHSSDHLLSSTESADNQKEETPSQPPVKVVGGEDGAWASFKKLMTPQKRVKRPSVDSEEGQSPGLVDGAKPGEGEQTSDHSGEEGKKRKDSSVSWEAVLCRSGRRRSRKTSDSDDEMPQKGNEDKKLDSEPKEVPLGPSDEVQEVPASSPKQSSPEGEEGSTWKSFKKLVTPKRKVKDEDESSSEAQDDSSFSIKKILPGRKDRRSAEKHDQVSSDEADKEVTSGDEDSETPAVVPLSEFDTAETSVQTQLQTDSLSVTEKAEDALREGVLDKKTEEVLVHGGEAKEIPESKETQEHEEPDECSDSIGNHQQLSDIPEEGVLTEPSPASIAEETRRDETISEDLNEITSEAITAPEPGDAAQADETEMISAVSQLTDSSKTSGDTTPVPAEYDVMDTETVLQQVSQTISVRSAEVPVCSEEPSPERVVFSVSHQILESSVTDQPKLLEIHRRSEATALKTGLNTEEIDAVNEQPATAQTENVSQLSRALSIEIVSEISTEEFDTAEPAADEVCEVTVSELQENLEESEISDESQLVEEQASTDNVPKEDVMEPNEKDTDPEENDTVKPSHVAVEGGEVQILIKEAGETMQNVSEQGEEPLPELNKLETLAASEVKSLKQQSLEDGEETEQTEDLSKVTDEPGKKDPETTGAKSDQSEEESEVLQAPTLDPDEGVDTSTNKVLVLQNTASDDKNTEETKQVEFLMEIPENRKPDGATTEEPGHLLGPTLETKEVSVSEEITSAEIVTDATNQVEFLSTISDESETNEPLMDGAKRHQEQAPAPESHKEGDSPFKEEVTISDVESLTKGTDESEPDGANGGDVDVTEELKVVQTPTLESQQHTLQSFEEEELLSGSVSPAQVNTDEHTLVESLTEVTDEPDGAVAEEEPDVLQASLTEPEEAVVPIKTAERVTDESIQVESLSKITESETNQSLVDGDESEHVEGTRELKAPTSELDEDVAQIIHEDESFSESVSPAEDQKQVDFLTEGPAEPESNEPLTDGAKTDKDVVQAPTSEPQEEVSFSESVSPAEAQTGDQKQVDSLSDVPGEPETNEPLTDGDETEHAEETKERTAPTIESDEDAALILHEDVSFSKSVSPAEVDTDDQKQVDSLTEGPAESETNEPLTDEDETERAETRELKTSEPQEEVSFSECVSPAEAQTGDQKQVKTLNKVPGEPETNEPLTDGIKTDQEVVEAPTSETLKDGGHLFKEEVMISDEESLKTRTGEPENTEPEAGGAKMDQDFVPIPTSESQVSASETVSPAQVDTDEQKLVEPPTKETNEQKNTEPEADGAKMDLTEDMAASEATRTPSLESQVDAVQMFNKVQFLESVSPAASDTGGQKQVDSLSEETNEPGNTGPPADVPEREDSKDTKHSVVTGASGIPQDSTLLESGDQPLEKEVTSEVAVPPEDLETNEEPETLTIENNSKTEKIPEPEAVAPQLASEAGSPETPKEEIKSPLIETVTDDPTQSTEVKAKSEASLLHVKDITKTDVETAQPPAAPDAEEGPAPEPEGQTFLPAVPQREEHNAVTAGSELHQASETNKDQEIESLPFDAQAEHGEDLPEGAEDLQRLTAVHVSSVNEEPGDAPVVETMMCPEKTPEPRQEKTEVSDEPTHEVNLCELQQTVGLERTGKLLDHELKVASTDQDDITHEVTHTMRDVSLQKFVLVQEPLINRMVSDTQVDDVVETATPLQRDDVDETAEESRVVVMLHVPLVESEENPRVQVQVVDVDIRSVEKSVETAIKIGVTEVKEVIDVCHESIEEVENLSATGDLNEDGIYEEIKVTVQEIMEHVKNESSERDAGFAELVVDVTGGGEMDENESNKEEDRPIRREMVMERHEEEAAVITDRSKTHHQGCSEDHKQTSRTKERLALSSYDYEDEIKETKAEVGDVAEETQGPQTTQSQIATCSSIGLATSQNAGVISSTANVESPSSLSLEFKLNIQFGQAKVQTHTETSEAAVQAAESVEPEPQREATQTSEKRTEQNEVTRAMEMTEPAAHLRSTQRAVIASRPVLQTTAAQAVGAAEPELIQSTEGESLELPAAEQTQEILSETRAKQPLESTEENDQDVWLDAEEDIYRQEETLGSTNMVDKPAEAEGALQQAEPEPETVREPETEDKESQRDPQRPKGSGDESEGDDFAVALEDLETSSSVDWD
nr:A-kinase anchor protein 12 [Nothobranchius furzeri]